RRLVMAVGAVAFLGVAAGLIAFAARSAVQPASRPPAVRQATLFQKSIVAALAISADGSLLASVGYDGSVRIQDLAGGGDVARFQTPEGTVLRCVAISPDRRLVVAAGATPKRAQGGAIHVWDVKAQREVLVLDHYAPVNGVVFGPDSKTLASGAADGS